MTTERKIIPQLEKEIRLLENLSELALIYFNTEEYNRCQVEIKKLKEILAGYESHADWACNSF